MFSRLKYRSRNKSKAHIVEHLARRTHVVPKLGLVGGSVAIRGQRRTTSRGLRDLMR